MHCHCCLHNPKPNAHAQSDKLLTVAEESTEIKCWHIGRHPHSPNGSLNGRSVRRQADAGRQRAADADPTSSPTGNGSGGGGSGDGGGGLGNGMGVVAEVAITSYDRHANFGRLGSTFYQNNICSLPTSYPYHTSAQSPPISSNSCGILPIPAVSSPHTSPEHLNYHQSALFRPLIYSLFLSFPLSSQSRL